MLQNVGTHLAGIQSEAFCQCLNCRLQVVIIRQNDLAVYNQIVYFLAHRQCCTVGVNNRTSSVRKRKTVVFQLG